MRAIGATIVVAVLGAMPASAAESMTGRWAMSVTACNGFGARPAAAPLIVTLDALRWSDADCRIARMYKTGETVHIQAICAGSAGEHSIPVSLRPHNGRLQVRWNRAAAGDLRRCP